MAKVIVGMSGGVDSAVAAFLLKEAGHEVIGVTLRTWISDDGEESRCCEIDDARAIAHKLGIPYHVFNCVSDFKCKVLDPFINDYIHGYTPNPCVICNRYIKWDKMAYFAKVLGADNIATGHYASVVRLDNGRYTVQKALHAEKDQTYMLYMLTQEQLAATLMPLGGLSKQEVRHIAEQAGIPVADKPDSQEICFVTEGHYSEFIEQNTTETIPGEGKFVDEAGNILGTHKGITHYTVGQRKGLGIALGRPAYVKQIRADTNEVVIGGEDSLLSRTVICKNVNWMGVPPLEKGDTYRCMAKIRYHHSARPASVTAMDNGYARIEFDVPVKAAAPGQSAVFYDGRDCVAGGGIIIETL